ncbi:hypothetical protein HEP84_56510 [Streptomyces sp. RLB1-33]|nr:hypothetical protein [Streptomyces sp. RLB1-33]
MSTRKLWPMSFQPLLCTWWTKMPRLIDADSARCVSVSRATMDRIMAWIEPGAHPRIAIG